MTQVAVMWTQEIRAEFVGKSFWNVESPIGGWKILSNGDLPQIVFEDRTGSGGVL
jgi:hypothetical protein